MEAPVQQRYSFGPFSLDSAERVLLRDGHPVNLPLKAVETLLVLVEKRGHVLEKSELLQRVWPATFVEEATLAQNIFTLRKVLGDSPHGHRYIETVPKRGYRFVAPVTAATGEEAPAPIKPVWSRSRPLGLTLVAILLACFALGLYLRGRSEHSAAASPAKIMLAVLPFENLSGDPRQEYFSDGLTEEMIAQLSHLNPEKLGVIARTSAMHYKGNSESAAQIGRELGVDYILESSFRREGNLVRITAQLVRVSDQTHVWTQNYERDAHGVLMLQKEVAGDIATQIALKLNSRASTHSSILNLDAYEAYLKGRFFWNKRSEQGHLKAIEYFNQAIAEDPGYAQAYSGLADAYALLGSNPTTAITRQEAMAKARAAALKAVSLDDTLAEAHTSLAFIYWHYDWNWAAAEKEFHRALELNPSYPTAHQWYAFYLISQGRIDQALEEITRAQETDPLSLIINTDHAEMLYYARQYEQAIGQARKVLEMDPDFSLARVILSWSLLAKQQYDAALAESKEAVRRSETQPNLEANLAVTYALIGQTARARTLLVQLQTQSQQRHTDELLMAIAQVHAVLGEKDQTFEWLEKDFKEHNGGLTLLKVVPFFKSLHQDSRFTDLVRRIGLPSS